MFSARCFEDNVGNRSQTISTITGEESVFCLPLFFSCFKFFSVIIYPVFVLQILFWNLKPSWVEMTLRNPPYQQQSDLPPSPPTSATIPSSTPFCCTCSTPFGLNVFPPDFCVLLLFYLLCEKGKYISLLFWCILPHIMGLSLSAYVKERITYCEF